MTRHGAWIPAAAMALAVVLLAPESALASGFLVYDHGAAAAAQGGAWVARASDPSALFYNPAGIAGLEGTQLYGGLTFMVPSNVYESESGEFKAEHEILFPPHIYLTWRAASKLSFGLGVFSQFGIVNEQANDLSPLRFRNKRAFLRTFDIQPVIALGDEQLSVAVGADWVIASLELQQRLLFPVGGGTAPVEISSQVHGSTDAIGWNAAARWANDDHAVGFLYRSEKLLELGYGEGEADFTVLTDNATLGALVARYFPDTDVALDLPLPATAALGYATKVNDTWIEFDITWTQWSTIDSITLDYEDETSLPGGTPVLADEIQVRDWKDTLSYRVGFDWNAWGTSHLRGGIYFDENPVPAATLAPDIPDADRWSASVGYGFTLGRGRTDMFYQYVLYDERSSNTQETQNPGRRGTYTQHAQIFGVSIGFKF